MRATRRRIELPAHLQHRVAQFLGCEPPPVEAPVELVLRIFDRVRLIVTRRGRVRASKNDLACGVSSDSNRSQ